MTSAQQRRAHDRQTRRRSIQSAARMVFAERGYAGSSIEQIARAAQLSVGAIYLYFRSKEDLYASLLEDALTILDVEFTHVCNSTDVGLRLPKMWAALLSWARYDAEGPRVLRLLAQPGVRTHLSDDVAATAATQLGKLQQHFAALAADGTQPAVFATLMWSLFLGVLDSVQIDQNLAHGNPDLLAERGGHALVALEAALGVPRPAMRVVA